MHNDRKCFFGRCLSVTLGFNSEAIGAWRQMGERNFIHTRLKTVVGLAIDAI